MLNRAAFNRKGFNVPEKPTEIIIREAAQETMYAAEPNVILIVPGSIDASGAIGGAFSAMVNTYRDSLEIPFDIQRLIEILNGSGYEAAYDHFLSSPGLPYILFRRDMSDNFFADNCVYERVNHWNVILCTEKKETETERTLEAVLDEAGICWQVIDEAYIKAERIYQIIYDFSEMED